MPFTIDKLPGEPIVHVVRQSENPDEELPQLLEALVATLDAQPEPVFLVIDARNLKLSLDNLIHGSSDIARGPGAVMHHPNMRETLMVTGDGMVKLAAQGLRSATFGNVKVRVFGAPEQAIDYCREQIRIASSQAR